MFSSILTVASAWVHLIVVDLFAARYLEIEEILVSRKAHTFFFSFHLRQVYLDGIVNDVETRHSLVLCLMFGPIGIMCHSITKVKSEDVNNDSPNIITKFNFSMYSGVTSVHKER